MLKSSLQGVGWLFIGWGGVEVGVWEGVGVEMVAVGWEVCCPTNPI